MAGDKSLSDELLKLHELKEKGIITEEEFNEQKARLLQRAKERPVTPAGSPSPSDQPTVIVTQTKSQGSGCSGCVGGIVAVVVIFLLLAIGGYF